MKISVFSINRYFGLVVNVNIKEISSYVGLYIQVQEMKENIMSTQVFLSKKSSEIVGFATSPLKGRFVVFLAPVGPIA